MTKEMEQYLRTVDEGAENIADDWAKIIGILQTDPEIMLEDAAREAKLHSSWVRRQIQQSEERARKSLAFYLAWPLEIESIDYSDDDDGFHVRYPALGLTASGETYEEAIANLFIERVKLTERNLRDGRETVI